MDFTSTYRLTVGSLTFENRARAECGEWVSFAKFLFSSSGEARRVFREERRASYEVEM